MLGHAARRSTTVAAPRLPLSKKSDPLSESSVSTASKPVSPSKSPVIAEGMRPDQMVVSKAMTKNPVFVMADTLAMMHCRRWYKMMLKLLWWLRHSATGSLWLMPVWNSLLLPVVERGDEPVADARAGSSASELVYMCHEVIDAQASETWMESWDINMQSENKHGLSPYYFRLEFEWKGCCEMMTLFPQDTATVVATTMRCTEEEGEIEGSREDDISSTRK